MPSFAEPPRTGGGPCPASVFTEALGPAPCCQVLLRKRVGVAEGSWASLIYQ